MKPDEISLDDIDDEVDRIELIASKGNERLLVWAIIHLHLLCDGAVTEDNMGFSGQHTRRGKQIGAKLDAGGKLTVPDVEWAKKAIPYYLNTQLKELKPHFKDSIEDAMKKAKERHEKYMFGQSVIIDKVNRLSNEECKTLLKTININECSERDRNFIRLMQNWKKPYTDWEGGQLPVVRRLLIRYWHLVKEKNDVGANHGKCTG